MSNESTHVLGKRMDNELEGRKGHHVNGNSAEFENISAQFEVRRDHSPYERRFKPVEEYSESLRSV